MSTATDMPDVLGSGDLRDVDEMLLDYLREGRVTPAHARERLTSDTGEEYSRGYIQQRLSRLEEHSHATNLGGGLYELVEDPRDDVDQNADAGGSDQERERLQERVDKLREQLQAARTGHTDIDVDDLKDARVFLDRALTELPEDVPGRSAAEDAKHILEEVLDDE